MKNRVVKGTIELVKNQEYSEPKVIERWEVHQSIDGGQSWMMCARGKTRVEVLGKFIDAEIKSRKSEKELAWIVSFPKAERYDYRIVRQEISQTAEAFNLESAMKNFEGKI